MVRSNTESLLGANLPRDYVSSFWEKAIPPKCRANKTEIVAAMAESWLELPDEVKKHYLYPNQDNMSFSNFVENIVEKKMKEFMAGVKTGQNAAGSEKAAQAHKGKRRTQPKSA